MICRGIQIIPCSSSASRAATQHFAPRKNSSVVMLTARLVSHNVTEPGRGGTHSP
jgi:hypothetical protein